jgi:hypothetical protein
MARYRNLNTLMRIMCSCVVTLSKQRSLLCCDRTVYRAMAACLSFERHMTTGIPYFLPGNIFDIIMLPTTGAAFTNIEM